MRKRLTVYFLLCTTVFWAQEKKGPVQGIKNFFKILKVQNAIDEKDYDRSIALAQKYLIDDPKNAKLLYKVGYSHFQLRNNAEAKEYFEKVESIDKEVDNDLYFYYAKTLQKQGKFEEANKYLDAFQSTLKKREKNTLLTIEKTRAEMLFAKDLLENPLEVQIKSLGTPINSGFDEYGPAVSADGKTLYFTSRRPDSKGGKKDPNDSKFLEDIYMSTWNDSMGFWNKAKPVSGKLNTEDHDGCLSISPAGDVMYLYRNEGEAGKGAGDIFYAKRLPSGTFTSAKSIEKPINTSFFESSASVTADGKKLYFISEDKDGYGRADIYVSENMGKNQWSDPVNLGDLINTKEDERMVFVHPDGSELYFSSNGHPSIGGYDIYRSKFVDGKWSAPENLGSPINSFEDEINFSITEDRQKAYFSGYLEQGFGLLDIYEINLSSFDLSKIKVFQKTNKTITPSEKSSK